MDDEKKDGLALLLAAAFTKHQLNDLSIRSLQEDLDSFPREADGVSPRALGVIDWCVKKGDDSLIQLLAGAVKLLLVRVNRLTKWLVILCFVAVALFWLGFLLRDLVPQPGNNQALPLASIPFTAYTYDGDRDQQVSQSSGILLITNSRNSGVGYTFDYTLPDTGSYAGLAFAFPEPQDLSEYEFIEVTISYGDSLASCDVYLKDIAGQGDKVHLSSSATQKPGISETIKIPLNSNFSAINRKVTTELGFYADADFIQGSHKLTVQRINFLKP